MVVSRDFVCRCRSSKTTIAIFNNRREYVTGFSLLVVQRLPWDGVAFYSGGLARKRRILFGGSTLLARLVFHRRMLGCHMSLLLAAFLFCHLRADGFSVVVPTTTRPGSNYKRSFITPTFRYASSTTNTNELSQSNDSVNGDDSKDPFKQLEALNVTLREDDLLPTAPPLTYDKFITMQDKRVVVTIRYSQNAGLRPYFLTVAKKLKASHPDTVIDRRILPGAEESGEAIFEILVDGKVVVGKSRARRQRISRVDMSRARSVFVSMQELDVAIARARRKRRPSTVYGEGEPKKTIQLEIKVKKGGGKAREYRD